MKVVILRMATMDFLRSALQELGYKSSTILLGKEQKSFTHFESLDGTRRITMSTESPLYPFATASARVMARYKDMAYDFAANAGVAIPRSTTISKSDLQFVDAKKLLATCGRIIVKPSASSISNGLTLNVVDEVSLEKAIQFAREYSDDVIVQQQVQGDEIRFVVIDGKTRAAILRQTPRVTGNGRDTLQDLIEQENNERRQIADTAVPYPQLDSTLLDLAEFDMGAVPADGVRIELGLGTMVKTGASIYDVTETTHPSYLEIAQQLGAKLGPGFVVVDMMLIDYTKTATSDNYAFIEFNLTPALQLFYSCRDGKHFDVAGRYLAPMIDGVLRERTS